MLNLKNPYENDDGLHKVTLYQCELEDMITEAMEQAVVDYIKKSEGDQNED